VEDVGDRHLGSCYIPDLVQKDEEEHPHGPMTPQQIGKGHDDGFFEGLRAVSGSTVPLRIWGEEGGDDPRDKGGA